jgi:hypothetical protein
LVFVGSNLQVPATGKLWQLWLLRNQSPKVVNAGLVHPGQFKNIWLAFNDGEVISDVSELELTKNRKPAVLNRPDPRFLTPPFRDRTRQPAL